MQPPVIRALINTNLQNDGNSFFLGEKSDDVDVSEKPTPLDWLTNSSFKPQEAVVIHQVNEAVSAYVTVFKSLYITLCVFGLRLV